MNTDFTPPLFEGKHEPVNQNRDREEDDWNHDDIIENLNQTKEDVEEQNSSTDDVGVVEFNLFIRVRTVLHIRAKCFQPFGCIRSRCCR